MPVTQNVGYGIPAEYDYINVFNASFSPSNSVTHFPKISQFEKKYKQGMSLFCQKKIFSIFFKNF